MKGHSKKERKGRRNVRESNKEISKEATNKNNGI